MSGFVVQGPKSDYRDSSGLKNRLYPSFYVVVDSWNSFPKYKVQ